MNFRYILILLSFLLFIGYSFADQVDLSLQREVYSGKDTMIVEIFVNEQPIRTISAADISLSRGSIAPILIKEADKHYYAYFNLPDLDDGNYDINVNLLYSINGVLKTLFFAKEFSVVNDLESSITVRPAVVKIDASKAQNYQIYAKNNNNNMIDVGLNEDIAYASLSKDTLFFDSTVERSFFIVVDKNKITSNQTKFIDLDYNGVNFKIPLLIYNFKEISPADKLPENITAQENITKIENETTNLTGSNKSDGGIGNGINLANKEKPLAFMFEDDEIEMIIYKNVFYGGEIEVKNNLDEPLNNIRFNLTGDLSEIIILNTSHVQILDGRGSLKQHLYINVLKNAEKGAYSGLLIASSSEGYYDVISIKITVAKDTIMQKSKSITRKIMGKKKEDNANGEIFNFTNSNKYEKTDVEKKSKTPLLIFLLVTALIVFIFYKLMTRKKPKSFDEYISSIKDR